MFVEKFILDYLFLLSYFHDKNRYDNIKIIHQLIKNNL